MLTQLFYTQQDYLLLLLRLVLAAVIFPHGAQKLLGWFGGPGFNGTMGFFKSIGIPRIFGLLAIFTEFMAPLALVAGLLTRVSALGVAIVMLTAAIKVHLPYGFFMNWNDDMHGEGYEYHILAIGIAILLIVSGGGAFSIDQALASLLSR